jgi:hypothetical protein
MIDELTETNIDNSGRSYYEPVTTMVVSESQYRDNEYALQDLPGYWQSREALELGGTYLFTLTSKPKSGPNSRAGSMYQDIRSAVPAAAGDEHTPSDHVPTPSAPRHASTRPTSQAPAGRDERQVSIEKGMAFNAAYTLIAGGLMGQPLIMSMHIPRIRLLRDLLYHKVILVPVAPIGYCYVHEADCQQSPSSGRWGHQVNGEWCVDGVVAEDRAEEEMDLVGEEPTEEELAFSEELDLVMDPNE